MPESTTNDGVRLHYEEMGQGRPLVLIHGWGFGGRYFVRYIDALAENFGVITLDLRGHGCRVPGLAKDPYDLLEALDE